MSVYNRFQPL